MSWTAKSSRTGVTVGAVKECLVRRRRGGEACGGLPSDVSRFCGAPYRMSGGTEDETFRSPQGSTGWAVTGTSAAENGVSVR